MYSLAENSIYVQILDSSGAPIPIYQHEGRNFIPARPGERYQIVVRNLNAPSRIEVLESVDGRDVLEDRPASFDNRGMIITDTWNNPGWRISDTEVRDFVFTDPASSIAAQATGDTRNVGVIGIAVFRERLLSALRSAGPTYHPDNWAIKGSGMQSRSSFSLAAPSDLGTGMGQSRQDVVGHATFERAYGSPTVFEIQYRTEGWLVEHGILNANRPAFPSAFPGSATGYAKYK